ncbi:MAG: DUF1289 domain-containing protein [Candidatus Dactylopiibacterium carminicum]|uniref:DUF1289 domain-containing protein n=1 Tax=Candidatus Dactylopiibacterium carminicum TaxID=857335 RepID=A0A272EW40_9RHOO|nr:DUF1289 domain-containing protein [Candidatus Dactylopiibacterium carminicum]KAF7599495.1 DUF1289 domain-containing protein [Candidatus Dactylopiibacterium carminicum]PAS94311.1 MAG: DUF1289 domain-containing protein [Candidatus Dactylopiibacterium carminicum]PAS98505.1 MAG: DUF1289 domain-containing protein [Candidatus Dactylopiibacterium carminicum]PAS99502.1 MAG: DUF1289 domain-containing protein [Candidatus Dactylopiibacterium carminicum]
MAQQDLPASPCVRRCCLDDHNVCLGCFRHVSEITGWQEADAVARTAILLRCEQRRAEHRRTGGQ